MADNRKGNVSRGCFDNRDEKCSMICSEYDRQESKLSNSFKLFFNISLWSVVISLDYSCNGNVVFCQKLSIFHFHEMNYSKSVDSRDERYNRKRDFFR